MKNEVSVSCVTEGIRDDGTFARRRAGCDNGAVTENSATHPTEWLPLPDVAELLGLSVGQVRRLIEDNILVASRRDGVQKVPSVFLQGAEPLSSLRGTVMVLYDVGLSTDEAIDWLLNDEDALGNPPIESLIAGRKAEVRRAAAVL